MNKTIIGIDPDSDRHGIAIFKNGSLTQLLSLNTVQLYIHLTTREKAALKAGEVEIHMENPKGNSSSEFKHKPFMKLEQKFKISESVGKVKQAQTLIEQMAKELNIPITLYRNSSMWKKSAEKKMFERATKWNGRSNEDTRSAAYFGFLGSRG